PVRWNNVSEKAPEKPVPFRATMNWPPPAHDGQRYSVVVSRITALGFFPSLSITQMFIWPLRSEMNAMLLPSGEIRGWVLMAMPLSWVRHSACPPEIAILYIWPSRSKTIQLPSGDTSSAVQVPSLVVKSISRVLPRGLVTSQLVSGGTCAAAGG